MKQKTSIHKSALFFWVLTILVASHSFGQVITANPEHRDAQLTAAQFVKRLQETRDINPLFSELFIHDFATHFQSDDQVISRNLFSHLTIIERKRLFAIETNAAYLIALDVLTTRYVGLTKEERYAAGLKSILPMDLADKLKYAIWPNGKLYFNTLIEFRSRLPEIERLLLEATNHLAARGLEQTAEFQKRLDDRITGSGLNYKVKTYVGGENIQDCETLIGFPPEQKFFRVETPLLVGLILVKHENQMKIVRITSVDGD